MTEVEWLTCADPTPMLRFLHGRTSERKQRLLVCGCCRRLWPLLRDGSLRHAVEVADQYADAEDFNDQVAPYDEAAAPLLKAVRPEMSKGVMFEGYGEQCLTQAVLGAVTAPGGVSLFSSGTSGVLQFARDAVGCAAADQPPRLVSRWAAVRRREAMRREEEGQSDLVREIYGPLPFCPVAVEPVYRTAAVIGIAETIYRDRAFDRMPALAAALRDAGCGNDDVLNHCRSECVHVRGCWVIDLLLGRG